MGGSGDPEVFAFWVPVRSVDILVGVRIFGFSGFLCMGGAGTRGGVWVRGVFGGDGVSAILTLLCFWVNFVLFRCKAFRSFRFQVWVGLESHGGVVGLLGGFPLFLF